MRLDNRSSLLRLLENGTQHTIKEVSEEFPDASKSAKKLIRKIKQVVGVQNLPIILDID